MLAKSEGSDPKLIDRLVCWKIKCAILQIYSTPSRVMPFSSVQRNDCATGQPLNQRQRNAEWVADAATNKAREEVVSHIYWALNVFLYGFSALLLVCHFYLTRNELPIELVCIRCHFGSQKFENAASPRGLLSFDDLAKYRIVCTLVTALCSEIVFDGPLPWQNQESLEYRRQNRCHHR